MIRIGTRSGVRGVKATVRIVSIWAAAAGLLMVGSAVSVAAPTRITRTFGGWVTSCTQKGTTSRCVIVQTLRRPHSKQRVAAWVISRNEKKQVTNRIVVPTGVNVADGIGLQLGTKRVTVPYSICMPRECQAMFQMDDPLQKALQAQKPIAVYLVTARGKTLKLTFNAKGFPAAFAQFEKPPVIEK